MTVEGWNINKTTENATGVGRNDSKSDSWLKVKIAEIPEIAFDQVNNDIMDIVSLITSSTAFLVSLGALTAALRKMALFWARERRRMMDQTDTSSSPSSSDVETPYSKNGTFDGDSNTSRNNLLPESMYENIPLQARSDQQPTSSSSAQPSTPANQEREGMNLRSGKRVNPRKLPNIPVDIVNPVCPPIDLPNSPSPSPLASPVSSHSSSTVPSTPLSTHSTMSAEYATANGESDDGDSDKTLSSSPLGVSIIIV